MTYVVTTNSPVGTFDTHDAAMQCAVELLKAGAFEVHVVTRNGDANQNVQIFWQSYLR